MNVTQKIRLGFGAILAVVAVGAATGYYYSTRAKAAGTRMTEVHVAELLAVDNADQQIAGGRAMEYRFVSGRNEADAAKVHERLAELKQCLQTLQHVTTDAARREAAAKASAQADAYLAGFDGVSALMIRRGLKPELGLEGELRNAVHAVETVLAARNLPALEVLMLTVRRHEKDYLLRGDVKYFDQLVTVVGRFRRELAQTTIPPEQQRELLERWDAYANAMQAVVAIDRDLRRETEKFRSDADALEQQLDALRAAVQADIRNAESIMLATLTSGARAVSTVGLVSLLIGTLFAVYLARSITRPLRTITDTVAGTSEQTAAAANQIASSSQTLAAGANEQAASLEETSASLEQLASMTRRNAENAAEAKKAAAQTRGAADLGVAEVTELKQAMGSLKASSDDISKIIRTIDDIAFQTNILALNAAVEAARAGEAGMGFAVVADEVRNLAQRSAQSAKETAGKIEETINKTDSGVQASLKVAHSLEQILQGTQRVDTLVAEIALASQEQSQGITQITTAVSQMDKVTQANAAGAEEAANASEELNAQAQLQSETVAELLALVGRSTRDGAKAGSEPRAALTMPPRRAPSRAQPIGEVANGRALRLPAEEAPPPVLLVRAKS